MRMTWEDYSEIQAYLQQREDHRIYVKYLLISREDCQPAIDVIDAENDSDRKIWDALNHWGALHRPRITGSMARKNPHEPPPLTEEEENLLEGVIDALHPGVG